MFQRIGVILDLSLNTLRICFNIEKHQNILEICSILISLFNSENPTSQIILLITKDQKMGQLTHLSGDIRHHNQGIWYFIFGNKKVTDYDLGFFFCERINVKKQKINYKLFFVSEGSMNFLDSNFFAVFMGKEKRSFSIISPGLKSFALQIITKITNGKYITLLNKKKSILSRVLIKSFQKFYFSEITHFLNLNLLKSRIVLSASNFKIGKRKIETKRIKFCPKCKNNIISCTKNRCGICGIFLTPIQQLFDNNNDFCKKISFNRNSMFVLNLFLPILHGGGMTMKGEKCKIFNFSKNKKLKIVKNFDTEIYIKNTQKENHEILATVF